jgi:AraC-like DNA-binding protein
MTAWKFTTDSFSENERRQAWCDAMSRLCLPVGKFPDDPDFAGSISSLTSPLGIEFALVEAGAHEISGRYPDQAAAIWLVLLLEGDAILTSNKQRIKLVAGDIIYGPTGVGATLKFANPFRQLYVKAPRLALNPRLVSPLSLSLGHLPGGSGINHVLSGMLRALADVLTDITTDQLRPIELALTEFLINSLAGEKKVFGLGGAAGARTAHLQRICQTIETLLSDPDLTPSRIAQEHGVSLRYMQKLFTLADNSFSHYVRSRRLERCRADLISPQHVQLSISEICFRWGFNGSAHFSRSFRNQYGVSPREYRQGGGRVETSAN